MAEAKQLLRLRIQSEKKWRPAVTHIVRQKLGPLVRGDERSSRTLLIKLQFITL